MKNEIKILIAAIIVVLIVLVGAFALSGSNNAQPSATPTVMPVTATPAPTGAPASTPAPTTVPSIAPTVTPTPVPGNASGVMQTEFGYWITYPPLGPETWGDPIPKPNVVYFGPTSASVAINAGTTYQGVAHLHRFGNVSGMTNVTIHVSTADFTPTGTMGTYELSNVVYLPDGNVRATFNPGESDVGIGITIQQSSYDPYHVTQALTSGSLKLTITDASGFSHDHNNEFTFNVGERTVVRFYRDWCYLNTPNAYSSWWGPPQYVNDAREDANAVYVDIAVIRDGDISDALTAPVTLDTNLPGGSIHYGSITFNAGDHQAIFEVKIDKTVDGTDVFDGTPYYAQFYLASSDKYVIGDVSPYYRININNVL